MQPDATGRARKPSLVVRDQQSVEQSPGRKTSDLLPRWACSVRLFRRGCPIQVATGCFSAAAHISRGEAALMNQSPNNSTGSVGIPRLTR